MNITDFFQEEHKRLDSFTTISKSIINADQNQQRSVSFSQVSIAGRTEVKCNIYLTFGNRQRAEQNSQLYKWKFSKKSKHEESYSITSLKSTHWKKMKNFCGSVSFGDHNKDNGLHPNFTTKRRKTAQQIIAWSHTISGFGWSFPFGIIL